MNKRKQVIAMVAIGLLGTQALVANADSLPEERRGVVIGGIIGASVGGPIGAGAGAFIGGALVGRTMAAHRINGELRDEVASARRERAEAEQQLKDEIARLDESLAKARSVEVVAKAAPEIPIQFKTGSSEIEDHYKARLSEIASVVSGNRDARVTLSGFADQRGDEAYNQRLSESRVKAVSGYLVAHGVLADQIDMRAFGESRPVGSEDNPETLFFDRRVVMQFSVDDDATPIAAR